MKKSWLVAVAAVLTGGVSAKTGRADAALSKPNIIIFFADDISAREFPSYGSSVWTAPDSSDTSDLNYRAKTPVLDRLAEDGCMIRTCWGATLCNPSRAMMMSGRYAHITKWWNNGDKGRGPDETGKVVYDWPVYVSSPLLLGHVAQKAGYGTYWSGKTQMSGREDLHGFDEGCFTPGKYMATDNPYTDFRHGLIEKDGKKILINADTGKPCESYYQNGWYWAPHVSLMNHPSAPGRQVWWPNTPEAQKKFGLHTFGPDVVLDFCFDFMERTHAEGKPFLIYHTSHLGHDAFNWLDPEHKQWPKSKWPNTPIVKWDGKKYTRIPPRITGDNGVYDTHGTITGAGIHNHVTYIDYQLWLYQQKLEQMGIADNTVIIVAADNGTSGYGKGNTDRQKGCHVPLFIYAPGMKKHGEQDVLANLTDIMPTVADLVGFDIPDDYEVNGKSLVPFLFTNKSEHRKWIYSYRGSEQLIRGKNVMKDGRGRWWDVSSEPDDLISFTEIKNWGRVGEVYREEHAMLQDMLPKFDLYFDEHGAPGVDDKPSPKNLKKYFRKEK
ncbi:sulfatase-like hydrolase/transferase [Pontiella agarivorans]|uniref:Sulfatase-like hydrolase/transferase n=1 Tax=Pontiella agarivorans TaxID=3038953 RepID=A0ABU5MX95_9BACT|nr:sulfatase-like hydrolase/transferase [Pontiella agarivorans]MDZ8118772.1 sulfatase-like hydrolase/transferase [Pontiella agarivorans]